ncbi:hypothetical protein MTO96_004711 [Rhipicephalus appendiculatus]
MALCDLLLLLSLRGSKERRSFPVPTVKGVFMFIGVVMIITVLGTAGYIFYKGPDSKSKRLVASEPPTNPPAEGRGKSLCLAATIFSILYECAD